MAKTGSPDKFPCAEIAHASPFAGLKATKYWFAVTVSELNQHASVNGLVSPLIGAVTLKNWFVPLKS